MDGRLQRARPVVARGAAEPGRMRQRAAAADASNCGGGGARPGALAALISSQLHAVLEPEARTGC